MCFKCWRNARTVQKTDWYAQNCCANGFTGWHKRNKPNQTGQYTFIRCFRYATQCCAFVCFSHFLLILATGLPEPAELFSSFSLFRARSRSFFIMSSLISVSLCVFVRVCVIIFSENLPLACPLLVRMLLLLVLLLIHRLPNFL